MPRRKQTQPMQMRNKLHRLSCSVEFSSKDSEGGKDIDDISSDGGGSEGIVENSFVTDDPGTENRCEPLASGTSSYWSTEETSDYTNNDTKTFPPVPEPCTLRTIALRHSSVDTDLDQSPTPFKPSSLPVDVGPEHSAGSFPEEIIVDEKGSGLKEPFLHEKLVTIEENRLKVACLTSGDEEASHDDDLSCHRIEADISSYMRDSDKSLSKQPGIMMPFIAEQAAATRQSSVKQLESFVASVECQLPPASRQKQAEKNFSSISQAPVAVLSRKCKNSRLKGHSVNFPKTSKQPAESVAPYLKPSDPNQPLDLSVKKHKDSHRPSETKYLSYSCSADVNCPPSGSVGSSLADLEKKFGNTSAIFDRIGTKTWASPFCGALMSRLGMNLYNSKLHGAFSDSNSAFGIGVIPEPVQQFNSSLASAAAPKSDTPLPAAKLESTEPAQDSEIKCRPGDTGFQWHHKHSSETPSDQRKHTNFQCSCGAELETLYHLTMHLQQTGHAPNKLKNIGRQEYSKLVRGQDMWLNHGCEQTRQILRCMECDESFKSLPELTVHMIQTKHYANIVGADALQRKPPCKGLESRASDGGDSGRIHCLVCLKPFDDAESLGNHIVEAGHYKKSTEKTEDLAAPKEETDSVRSKRNSRSMTPFEPVSPQSSAGEDSSSRDEMLTRIERDRKREHSFSESSLHDDCKISGMAKRYKMAYNSASEEDQDKRCLDTEADEIEHHSSPIRFSESVTDTVRCSTSPSKQMVEQKSMSPEEQQLVKGNDDLSESHDGTSFRSKFSWITDGKCSDQSSHLTKDSMEIPPNSSAFHTETFVRPPSNGSSECSAIQAMETFIKNSFGCTDVKRRSAVLQQIQHLDSTSLVGSLISRFGSYMDGIKQNVTRIQDSQSVEGLENSNLYQNKYLPPVYMVPSSQDDQTSTDLEPAAGSCCWSVGQKIKSESTEEISIKEPDLNSHDRDLDKSDGEAAERSGWELEGMSGINVDSKSWLQAPSETDGVADNARKQDTGSLNRNVYPFNIKLTKTVDLKNSDRYKGCRNTNDDEENDRPSSTSNSVSGSSALESLEGLVYGKALNSEHPLDSLQKLIYGRGGSGPVGGVGTGSGTGPLNGSHATAVIMKGTEALQHPLPPGTLILVNPIVTVVPGASGSSASLSISFPPGGSRSPDPAKGATQRSDSNGHRHRSPSLLDNRENGLRVYRCRGCRRKFSSKGSYRYHLSRCHVLTSSDKCSKDPLTKNPYLCLPLDAKFNKYYKLANELGTEAK